MERVVNECASHLINDLTKDTCLDTRSLPGINRNKSFVAKVDQYIAENVSWRVKFPPAIRNSNFSLLINLLAVPRADGEARLPSFAVRSDRDASADAARDGR